MRVIFLICLVLTAIISNGQSYVDLGIRHFAVKEYDEALVDFEEAEKIVSMIPEASKAKLYYYRGMIWLMKAEESEGNYAEENPIQLAHLDLTRVLRKDNSWEPQVKEAFNRLYQVIMTEADSYLKLEKKAEEKEERAGFLEDRVTYLKLAESLDISASASLNIGQTYMNIGNIFFENSTDLQELQKAKSYYEESLRYYELARYDDPFSKKIIEDLLTLSRRLGDKERIEEYEKLLELAGG